MLLLLLGGDVSLNPGPFTLGVLNARFVRNKGPLLADMVASYDLDLLCLTETHIRPFDSDSFLRSITPPDFNFPHKPRPSGIGGGVGFFIRSSYRPHIIETPCYQSFENIVVSIGLHGHSVLLACIYRPPGSCTCNFLEEFMSFVGYLSSINSSYYICGDFNIHVDVPVGDGQKFTTFLDSCDLKQLVNKPTHLHGHILDLILSPCDQDTIADVKICDFVSDHALVKCSVAFPCQVSHTPNVVQYRRFHRINMSDFRSDLKNTSFVKSPADAVVDLYDQYVHDLSDVLDRHAPLISKLTKKESADWMSDDYRRAKSLRRQFERTWRRAKSTLNRSRLRRQIARCNALVNKDKSDYYSKLISDNSHDSRKLWRELHKTLNRVSDATLPSHESEKSLADQFASFFTNKIKKIRDNFASSGTEYDVNPPSDPPQITVFRQVSEDAVDKIIKASPTKSCLLDPLPTFLIKECIDILLPSLTKLVNCSLMEGCVPDAFKSAVVTPLIKKPNLPSNDLKNYRPVSGLSFISKLVECVVAKQLLEHINANNLDNPYQSAYKAGHSTETALLYIKNEVHLSLSRGESTALVLLDLSAAFDTIDHSTLLGCLQNWFGVSGSVLKWFTSYLMDRYQSVKIGSTLSDVCKLLFGVPQGSVLGPLLFSLYTTPLSSIISKHNGIKFHFYADDSQLYIHLSQKNASSAFEKLNKCLNDVKEWMTTSKLKLNPDKTEFIIFGSKRQRDKLKACFPIDILGNSLCPADSVKNLGVWLDSDFSLSKHVQNVCKSCFVKLRDFRHVRRFLTHDVSVLVANALVSSRLDYCNSLFRSLSKFNLRKLQCIQNSAARIVSNTSRYTSITPVLKKLHWLPVEQRIVFKTVTLVYKYLHTGFPRYFSPHLSSYSSSYSTRRSESGGNFLVIPKFCPSVHKSVKQFGNSFAFDAPTVWNTLPDVIRASPSLASFRKQLKTYLYTKAYPP